MQYWSKSSASRKLVANTVSHSRQTLTPPEELPRQYITELSWGNAASYVKDATLKQWIVEGELNHFKSRLENAEMCIHRITQELSQIKDSDFQPSREEYAERWMALNILLDDLIVIGQKFPLGRQAQATADELEIRNKQLLEGREVQRDLQSQLDARRKEATCYKSDRDRYLHQFDETTKELADCRDQLAQKDKQSTEMSKELADKEEELDEERARSEQKGRELGLYQNRLDKMPHWVRVLYVARHQQEGAASPGGMGQVATEEGLVV